jgi:hypothetical protein
LKNKNLKFYKYLKKNESIKSPRKKCYGKGDWDDGFGLV